MHRLALVFSVVISLLNNQYSKVEKIEYSNTENSEEFIYLNITIDCYFRDVITLKINNNEEYYESSLIIENKKETRAKIPFKIKEKSYLKINIISNNENINLTNIEFPVYPKNNDMCDLNKNKFCKSKYPSKVIYENGKIEEYYELMSLNMESTNIFSFNNLIPINKISLYALNFENGDAYLYLNKKVDNLNIYYDKKYAFPLKMITNKNSVNFEFSNNYYINEIKGETYENYVVNTRIDNNILLPYVNETYEMKLVIYESNSFEKVTLKFNVVTEGNLIGNKESKYILKRSYL